MSAYKLAPLTKREMAGLPLDLATQDTYLCLITKSTESKKGGGINIELTPYGKDGKKQAHQNGSEEIKGRDTTTYMPFVGGKFASFTKAIFPECDELKEEVGWDLDDMLDRFVYVTFENDQERMKNTEELGKWGPKLNVKSMSAVPAGEKEYVRQLTIQVTGHEPKNLASKIVAKPAATAASTAPKAAVQTLAQAQQVAGVPAGVDPLNPFGL